MSHPPAITGPPPQSPGKVCTPEETPAVDVPPTGLQPSEGPPTDADPAIDESESVLGLSAGDRRFLFVTGSLIVLLSALNWARLSGWGLREVEIHRLPAREYEFQVDINRATWIEWMQLDGIGELTARKIVEDRTERGAFQSIAEVQRVKGIGPKTFAKLKPWLVCADCESMADTSR